MGVQLLGALLDAVVPPLCVLCRARPGPMPWLCVDCSCRLTLFTGARCLRCGAPRPLPTPLCARCPDFPRRFGALRSTSPHTGAARDLVNALMFGGSLAAARPLGHLVVAAARMLPLPAGTVVVPVPVVGRRRRARGYACADELARVLAPELGLLRRPRWLRRIRPDSGTIHRTRRGRERETRGAFRAPPSVSGQPILLVDVSLSTGATLASCSRALFCRGAAGVWAATATRAP